MLCDTQRLERQQQTHETTISQALHSTLTLLIRSIESNFWKNN